MVAFAPGTDCVEQLPETEGPQGLFQEAVAEAALPEIVGIGNEHGLPRNPAHFQNSPAMVGDVVEDAKGAHEIDGVVAKVQIQGVTGSELRWAQAVGVANCAQFGHGFDPADGDAGQPPQVL